ncbi:RNA recognition domain-containing protein [Diplocarpon rosae]|nr:RNA recognition domain-containing protein [Diplocarpon rosae]
MTTSLLAGGPPPNATVYVRNLEERIKLPTISSSLKELFSEYGTVLDVVAKGNLKAKGQAFVVFDNVASAQQCIEEVQGFELFGKPMQLAFAKTRSDAFILFLQNLPEDYDIDALTAIFGRFEGFREVRLVPGRRGIAFVEYDNEAGAITAKENTAGMSLSESQAMKVTYQRQ